VAPDYIVEGLAELLPPDPVRDRKDGR